MAKGICPGCGERREIVPGELMNKDPGKGFSARWWEVEVHKDPKKPELCKGSGARI